MPRAGRWPVGQPSLRSEAGGRRPAGFGLIRVPHSLRQSLPMGPRPAGKAVPPSAVHRIPHASGFQSPISLCPFPKPPKLRPPRSIFFPESMPKNQDPSPPSEAVENSYICGHSAKKVRQLIVIQKFMQNKGFFQFLTVIFALACLYHLSFTFLTRKVEREASEYAGGDPVKEKAYLDSVADEKIFGLVTYRYAKLREMNLGLDLKGGMNVTLEVSVPDLLLAMANYTEDPAFHQALARASELQRKQGGDYITHFINALKEQDPNISLASPTLFGHKDQERINYKMSNEEVEAILRQEAETAVDRTYEVLLNRIDKFGVTQPNIQKLEGSNRILVELPGIKDPKRAEQLLQATAKLEFWETYDMRKLIAPLQKINDYLAKLQVAEDSDTTGTSGRDTLPSSSSAALAQGDSASAGDTASLQTQEELLKANPLFSILQLARFRNTETGAEEFMESPIVGYIHLKDTGRLNRYLRMPAVKSLLPPDVKLLYGHKAENGYLPVYGIWVQRRDKKAPLEGDVITDASFRKNEQGAGFMVEMSMNAEGAEKWAKITEANVGKAVAIVLDDVVYSAPVVNEKIPNGRSSITGNFDYEEAKSLASVLKGGKLPVPARIVEKAVVGPSLGAQSIRSGLLSMIVALVVVLIYMAFYYNRSGLVADVALFANILFLTGTLAALNTTLTLPGIAGIVLTFGMSVDANVLIFERIREELAGGKGLRLALSDGYQRAYSSIVDANVTTLLTAIVLMVFGAGPVKGFAVVLFVGILTSLFAAIFVTRLIFEALLSRKKIVDFETKLTANAFRNIKINFLSKRKAFYGFSTALIAAGIVSFFTKGFNLGVDLKGGRTYTISFDQPGISTTDLAKALAIQLGEEPVVKYFGSTDKVKVITDYKYEESSPAVEEEIVQKLYEAAKPFYASPPTLEQFADEDSGIGITSSEKVGPTVAGDTKTKSIYAIIFALIIMFIYIVFRFRGWQFGLAATAALMHDVLITLSFFSLLEGIMPFSMEIDQTIIAAVLTVIGYSINDTVVVFDRIREYFAEHKRGAVQDLINSALNSTLSRTFNTSITTLLVLLIIFIFGGPAIKGMCFALLVGIGVGTYSSVCIASPLVLDLGLKTRQTVPQA
ncbi:MAG: protein translocase subunit SecDF [Flavobacteriales bacterium]|nr:protein translocase subunit SecDF [Flavobacteriales bacterium]